MNYSSVNKTSWKDKSLARSLARLQHADKYPLSKVMMKNHPRMNRLFVYATEERAAGWWKEERWSWGCWIDLSEVLKPCRSNERTKRKWHARELGRASTLWFCRPVLIPGFPELGLESVVLVMRDAFSSSIAVLACITHLTDRGAKT